MQKLLRAHELTYQAVCFMHNQDIENQGYTDVELLTKITGFIIIICIKILNEKRPLLYANIVSCKP